MLYSARALTTRRLTIVLYCAVLALLVMTTFYPQPVAGVSILLILSVKLLPLLPFIPTVLRGDNRGYIWLSFVLIFYFTQAVVTAWLSQGALLPTLQAVLTLALFTVAMFHLKLNRSPVAASTGDSQS